MEEPDDSYYTKCVTELGDTQAVTTNQAIFTTSGIKLINPKTQINSLFYERLVQYKLTVPLEQCLTVENAVDNDSIVAAAQRLLQEDLLLAHMMQALSDGRVPLRILKMVQINAPLAFKLTVARERRPWLFTHSVRVALISIYLGLRCSMQSRELYALAAAALFHDLGELHLVPALFGQSRRLTPEERRHTYTHPKIMQLILQKFPEYRDEISAAVLEHHERMDGSGYPRGIKGEQISRLGQILAVAVVVGSKLGKNTSELLRLETMLKLNSYQFGRGLVGYLLGICQQDTADLDEEAKVGIEHIREWIDKIEQVFSAWRELPRDKEGAASFVGERLSALRIALLDAGFNPEGSEEEELDSLQDDPKILAEMEAIVQETLEQIKGIAYEVKCRWPESAPDADEQMRGLHAWLERTEQVVGLK